MKHLLAIDIGAESGRAILGTLKDGKLTTQEIHRFPNGSINVLGGLHWNVLHLYEEILAALDKCVHKVKVQTDAIGVDTWGVDYAIMNKDGCMLGLPFAYRDCRTDHAIEEFTKIMPKKKIYELTGIQFMQFNTLFQLYAEKNTRPVAIKDATDLIFMPDIINYLLTGIMKSEFTFATTSQLYNPKKMDWEQELFDALGISKDIMQEVLTPGSKVGDLADAICEQTGMNSIPIIAVASHDTGSAIAAIPAEGDDWAYISSGTWSLMGIESKVPIISDKSYKYNVTNEGGVENTFRVLKNIMGLWLLQQSRKAWEREKEYTYGELVKLTDGVPLFKSVVDPDHQSFLNPPNMPEAIDAYCESTGQEKPGSHGEYVQAILQSLALKYRLVLDQLNELSPKPLKKIYITGGGVQNELLNQYVANATGVEVIATLPEGTAVGNIMVQAMALGEVKSLAEIRKVIADSHECNTFAPQNRDEWEAAYHNYLKIISYE